MNYLVVFIGGGIGSVTRYFLSKTIYQVFGSVFPLGTLVINLSGCLAIGLLYGLFDITVVPPNFRLFCLVGFLGGFTTFSSFGLESVSLIIDREFSLALLNVILSTIAGLMLVYGGIVLSRLLFLHKS
ncbi:MAG: fluoride efflux transporter CrcB [Brevinematales bacterium]